MCGRFKLESDPDDVTEHFSLPSRPALAARAEIAPTQPVAAVRPAEGGGRELAFLAWGLVPSWSRDRSGAARMINARAETVATKPAFRVALARRRCLLPADGFYEWRHEGRRAIPWLFEVDGGRLFAFAGLWERWQGPDGPLETCTLLTCAANGVVGAVHDRMPVILDRAVHDRWIDPAARWEGDLETLAVPFPDARMTARELGRIGEPRLL